MKRYSILILLLSLIILLICLKIFLNYEGFQNNEDETTCIYVSSHGIKKSCKSIENCYYVKSDQLNDFKIPNKPFILVTGDEDTTIPDDFLEKSTEILNSTNLIHWYSQNLNLLDNSKISSIPIGLDYHTLGNAKPEGSSWGSPEIPNAQEEYILNLKKKPFYNRIPKIYINFKKSIRGRYGEKDRKDAIEQIPSNLQVIEEDNIPRKETWKKMSEYTFVASPHGNGLDCHRTWEALVLGCIPIVKRSSLDNLYEGLPVLIVNSWSDINEELLKNTINEFKNNKFNYNKLKLQYWLNKIKNS